MHQFWDRWQMPSIPTLGDSPQEYLLIFTNFLVDTFPALVFVLGCDLGWAMALGSGVRTHSRT